MESIHVCRIPEIIRLLIEDDSIVIEAVAKYLMASAWNESGKSFPQTELTREQLE